MQVWLLKCCRKGWLPVSIDQHWRSVRATIGSLSQSLMFAGRLFKKCWWFPVFSIYSWGFMKSTVLIGTCRSFSVPSPDLCLNTVLSQRSVDSFLDFMAWFEFSTGGLSDRSSGQNIWQMIGGNKMHLSSIFNVTEKTVNIYAHVKF